MKNTLFTILASVVFSISYAQTVNDGPLKDIDVEYAMIVGTAKFFSSKVSCNFTIKTDNPKTINEKN